MYCQITSNVQFESTKTTLYPQDIKTEVINSIINYSKQNLQAFNSDLRYSKLVATIDSADASITSNETKIKLIKRKLKSQSLKIDFYQWSWRDHFMVIFKIF